MARGTLVIIGSGEISPGMVKIHRDLFETHHVRAGTLLDSPFGFQENVPQLTAKIIEYFEESLHVTITPASLRRVVDASALARATFLANVRTSQFVFAGPGSPSYAMRQWADIDLVMALRDVLDANGLVTFASAAALTLGAKTAPIYELYKVGDDPYWLDGLDLLATYGLKCAVIPHFDNAEGGNHDTRFCYLGERRLRILESQLDDDTAILGVDEHTAVVFNWERDSLRVHGRGAAYWRLGTTTRTLARDADVALDSLRNGGSPARDALPTASPPSDDLVALGDAVVAGGPDGVTALAQLLRRAANGGDGLVDPAPLVEGVLRARQHARAAKQFDLADELRDAVVATGIEVHDTPDGATWSLPEDETPH